MGFGLKRFIKNVADPGGLFTDTKKKKQVAPVDPDPINPLTGRPMSQDIPQQSTGMAAQGLGQIQPAYLPAPVSMAQRIPQGLGSDVFRSTLAPLQQQGYGLGQVDSRFLQGVMQQPGGQDASIPFGMAGQPVSVQNPIMLSAQAPAGMHGLGQRALMGGGLGSRFNPRMFY